MNELTDVETRSAPAALSTRAGRFVLAALGAFTLGAAPWGDRFFGFAGQTYSAHSAAGYGWDRLRHTIGNNAWAYQGTQTSLYWWISAYLAVGFAWLLVTFVQSRRDGRPAWRLLAVAWGTLVVTGLIGALCARYGPIWLSDLGSPWWAGVAVAAYFGVRERNRVALSTAAGYAALLAIFLLTDPSWLHAGWAKGLVLAIIPAAAALA